MKAIHYDAEGDILSITFVESAVPKHTGVELSENIVLYLDPATEEPVALILSSYQAMLRAHAHTPLLLDGLQKTPAVLRAMILQLLDHPTLSAILQVADALPPTPPVSHLRDVFAPSVLQTVTAG